jgi:lipopolysaccharide export system permease protein
MRASGVSLTRIVSPFIMLGLLGASLIFLCSEYIIAPTTIRYEQLRDEYFEDNTSAGEPHVQIDLAIMGDENRLYHARSYDPNSHELKDVTILEHDAQKQLSGKIYARTARWERQGWVFYNGFTAQLDPLGGLLNTVQQFDRKEMHLGERPTDFEHPKIRPELMRFFHLRLYLDELNNASAMTRRRLEVELWYKLSMPFACIVMAFLGVPFSLRNRSGMLAGMGMSVLCGMLYYGMLAVCIALGKGGTLPPSIAVWVPHGVFTVFAFYLLYRVR